MLIDGVLQPAVIRVMNGVITAIEPFDVTPDAGQTIDAGDDIVLPALGMGWYRVAPTRLASRVARGAAPGGLDVARLSERMSAAPARLAGWEHRKGRLAPGFDADLVIWSPDAPVDVDSLTLYHRHTLTPYRDAVLTGVVRATYVRGAAVYRDGSVTTSLTGQIIQ